MVNLPHSPSTEASVLGSVLVHGLQWWDILVDTGGDLDTLFFGVEHRKIASIFSHVVSRSNSLTTPLILDYMRNVSGYGTDESQTIIDNLVKSSSLRSEDDLSSAISQLADDRAKRELVEINESVTQCLAEGKTSNEIIQVMSSAENVGTPMLTVPTMGELIEEMESQQKPSWAIPTDLRKLDECLQGGFESGKFYVVAAGAKMGKTTFLLSAVERALSAGAVVIVFSLETIKDDFLNKMMANVSGLDRNKIIRPFTRELDFAKKRKILEDYDPQTRDSIIQARAFLRESKLYPVFESDMPNGFDDIAPMIQAVKKKHEGVPVLAFVDHLGLLVDNSAKKDERIQLQHFTKNFAKIARNQEIALVSLVQINRAAGENRPEISHLRGSGSIEQDCHSAILLHRKRSAQIINNDEDNPDIGDGLDPNIINIHLALNRSGPVVSFDAAFDGARDTISDIEEDDEGIF